MPQHRCLGADRRCAYRAIAVATSANARLEERPMGNTPQTTEDQRRVACYLFLSPYHPETWPMVTIDRLVRLWRERGYPEFLREVRSMTYHACCG